MNSVIVSSPLLLSLYLSAFAVLLLTFFLKRGKVILNLIAGILLTVAVIFSFLLKVSIPEILIALLFVLLLLLGELLLRRKTA
jgi:presenilin-like A22 family membrane protease